MLRGRANRGPHANPTALLRARRTAPLITACLAARLVAGCAATGVAAPDIDVGDAVLGHELLGFDATGALVVRSTRLDHRGALFTIEVVPPPKGPARVVVRSRAPIALEPDATHVPGAAWQRARPIPPQAAEDSPIDDALAEWPAIPGLPIALAVTHTRHLLGPDVAHVVAHRPASDDAIVVAEAPIVGALAIGGLQVSPDARWAVVSLRIGGRPGLHVIDVRRAHAALLVRAGLDAHFAGDAPTARARLEAAIEADPRSGDAMYDLACLDALAGADDVALERLRVALSIDPVRYRRLAREDPDLARIVSRPEICPVLSTCPRGGESISQGPR